MKIENIQDFIDNPLNSNIKEIAGSIGFIYLNSIGYSWNFGEGKLLKMTEMSLRQLKDGRKQIIKDRDALNDSCIDLQKILTVVGQDKQYFGLELDENQETEVKSYVMNEIKELLCEKEKDLNLEISMRP